VFRDEVVHRLRLHAHPQSSEERVIKVLCKLLAAEELDDEEERVLGKPVAQLPVAEVRQILLNPRQGPHPAGLSHPVFHAGPHALLRADLLDGGRVFIRGGKGNFDRYGLIDPDTLCGSAPLDGRQAHENAPFQHQKESGGSGFRDRLQAARPLSEVCRMDRRLTPHVVRHNAATHCFQRTMPLAAVAALLGHYVASATSVYADTSIGRYRADYLRCHPLANGELVLAPTPLGEG